MADDRLEDFSAPALMVGATAGAAPRERGVQVLMDSDGSIVYVGKTGKLRDRLQQHLSGDREGSVLREQVGTLLTPTLIRRPPPRSPRGSINASSGGVLSRIPLRSRRS